MTTTIRRTAIVAGIVLAGAGAGVNYASVGPADAVDERNDELHLVVNIPANRLYVYENGERTRTYAVSVGLRGYETPPGEYSIREVIWNPWWHPPSSDWARGRKPESPGEANPMGRVKLNFGPLLYIHGTAEYQALSQPASRGCVRMRNSDVIELTRLIHQYASPRVKPELIDQLEASETMTRTIRLSQAVKFTAEYTVATVDDGFLILYPDIYNRVRSQVRDEVEETLEREGVDLRQVNREHLERLLEKSSTRRVAISLQELTSPASPAEEDTNNHE